MIYQTSWITLGFLPLTNTMVVCGLKMLNHLVPFGKLTGCYWTWPLSSLIYPLKMVIFYSYVSFPEGSWIYIMLYGYLPSTKWWFSMVMWVFQTVIRGRSSSGRTPQPPFIVLGVSKSWTWLGPRQRRNVLGIRGTRAFLLPGRDPERCGKVMIWSYFSRIMLFYAMFFFVLLGSQIYY